MDRTAIEKIEEMSKATPMSFNGVDYTDKPVHMVKKPVAVAIVVGTLTGIIDYVKANVDDGIIQTGKLFIHVESHKLVKLVSPMTGDTKQRDTLIQAEFEAVDFRYDHFYTAEQMVIKLRTCFVQTDEMKEVIRLVGNVKDEAIKTIVDDGISQQTTVKVGAGRIDNVTIPNPVTLKPYRTFYEAEQPASEFLLRQKRGDEMPIFALFTADGGQWKSVAQENIKKRILAELPEITMIG